MRASLYGRVSSEEQVQGYSLDAQRRAFRSLVDSRHWSIHREYIEEGRSAHTDDVRKRPVFIEAIRDAEAGKYDVLVVHNIDRFSRRLSVTLEYFERLGKAGVGFVSIENQYDYSTPSGKFMLVMQGGLAELYSDNLGQEVRKGLDERLAQGLYRGLLPFGVLKGEAGVPERHPDTYPGLLDMFEQASQGRSDREIAQRLNSAGCRTAGNQGNRLFSKDTVRGILTNRFYIGEISDGNGGWAKAKHEPLIQLDLFQAALAARGRNRRNPAKSTRADARVSSLSGVARCFECGASLRTMRNRGVARMVCNTRLKRGACTQKSARVEVYESQLLDYLNAFQIPDDYQVKLLEAQRRLTTAYDEQELRKRRLLTALDRLKELYKWSHMAREDYLAEAKEIEAELESLEGAPDDPGTLEKFAQFLRDVGAAWSEANEKQRNKLARTLFDAVWIQNQGVLGVTPRSELKPFFDLQYSGLSNDVLQWRPRPDSNRRSSA